MAVEEQSNQQQSCPGDQGMEFLRRAPILQACRDDVLTRRELTETTDASRTTVYQATVEFEQQGLLNHDADGYRTTPKGTAMASVVEAYRSGIDTVDRLEPLFEIVDHPDLLDRANLRSDAKLTVADDDNMYRANDRFLDLWAQCDTIRAGMVGSGSRICLKESSRLTVENDMDVEMCYLPDVVPTPEHLDTGTFGLDELIDCLKVYVTEAVPFRFLLMGDTAGFVAKRLDPFEYRLRHQMGDRWSRHCDAFGVVSDAL